LSACANRRGTVCPPVQIDGVLFVRVCKNDGVLFVRGTICPEPSLIMLAKSTHSDLLTNSYIAPKAKFSQFFPQFFLIRHWNLFICCCYLTGFIWFLSPVLLTLTCLLMQNQIQTTTCNSSYPCILFQAAIYGSNIENANNIARW